MKNHWDTYSRAYLVGFVFFLLTVGNAFVAQFENLTPAQAASMTKLQWWVAGMSVVVQVCTNLLAFLNQSAAKQPPVNSPTPTP